MDGGTRATGGLRRQRCKQRIDLPLELVELTHRAGDRVGGYRTGCASGWESRRAAARPGVAAARRATTGLDPGGMRDMRELVRRLASEGITIISQAILLTDG